jgi:putative ABC transport system permease protein
VLAIGLHLVVTVGAVAESFERSILGWLGQASALDLVVTASGTLTERTAAPLDADLADALAAIPGVAEVRPIRETHVRFRDAEIGLRAWALGEPPTPRDLERFTFLEGRAVEAIPALVAGDVALVSQNLAHHFGLHAGDVIDLPAPAGTVRVRIAGVVLDYLAQSGTVIVARPAYVRHWQDPLADGFGIGLAAGASAEETRAQIAERLGERFDLVVLTLGDYLAEARTLIRRGFLPLRAIEVVTLVIGLLSLVNALLVSVAERFRELGLLRASGASMRQLVVMILVEAEATTAIAVLLGVASGIYGSQAWIRVHIPVATGWIVPYVFPFAMMATALGAAFALAAGAGAWPARLAARTPVVEALRAES